jgi:hypothetical protein
VLSRVSAGNLKSQLFQIMTGKTALKAGQERRAGLARLACSSNRAEAGRAPAILLTLAGWTSAATGEAFGLRNNGKGPPPGDGNLMVHPSASSQEGGLDVNCNEAGSP